MYSPILDLKSRFPKELATRWRMATIYEFVSRLLRLKVNSNMPFEDALYPTKIKLNQEQRSFLTEFLFYKITKIHVIFGF